MRRTNPALPPRALTRCIAVLVTVLAAPTLATAQSAFECAPTSEVDPLRLVRQASLDLRGVIPTVDELERVRRADDPSGEANALIEAMVGSEAYYSQVRDHHRKLLWGSLGSVGSLQSSIMRMTARREGSDVLWFLPNNRRRYRGNNTLHCANEPAEFDPDTGEILTTTVDLPGCPAAGCQQEGYVMVEPYWRPGTEIRVCAFDAQTNAMGTNNLPCDHFNPNPACGCGEDLRYCMRNNESGPLRRALEEEPARIFEWTAREDRSYLDAFTTRKTFVNGASAFFYNYQTTARRETSGGPVVFDSAYGDVPNMSYTDPTWVEHEREEAHSGVLTTTSFLLRFASDRGRANRFYEAFYCDPFVPSEDGLPPAGDNPPPNLRERDGCADCHQVLEPAADHWARWREGSTMGYFRPDFLSFTQPRMVGPASAPIPDCQCGGTTGRNCNFLCRTYFVTADNSHEETFAQFGGLPTAMTYMEEGDLARMEIGPAALVDEEHEQNQIARCATRRLAEGLLNRSLQPTELSWLEDHAQGFIDSGFRYNELVRGLVVDAKYRSIR